MLQQPDAVIVDVSQLLYHTVWPCGGSITDLVGSITEHAARAVPQGGPEDTSVG